MSAGRPKTKRTQDYRVMTMTSTSVKVICTRCNKEIKKGQRYYYKLGDEMHETCDDLLKEYKLKSK